MQKCTRALALTLAICISVPQLTKLSSFSETLKERAKKDLIYKRPLDMRLK